ncbi:uncharacterized protein [Porites lutea]|uniref:uncharacterized protein n=1 Tax=Porites lutea TaxID=51062 RepID=UPI003CC6C23A
MERSRQPQSDDSETGCLTSVDSEVKINEKEKLLRSKSTDGTQTSLQDQSSSKLQKKWQAFSQKTYKEIASACPGGTGENNLLLTGSHLEGKQEQRTFVNSDHHKIISVEVVYTRDQPNYDQGDFPRENASDNDHLNQQQNENETQGERRQEANATDAASEQFGESSLSGRTTETHFYSTDTQGIEVVDTRDRQRNGQGDLPRENPSRSVRQNQQQNENETQGKQRQEANAIDSASEQFGEFLSSGTHIYSTDTQGNQVVDSPDQPRDDPGDFPPENASFSDSLNQQQNENVSETQGEHRQEANATDAASEQFEESSSSGRTSETHFHSTYTQGNRVRQTLTEDDIISI